MPRRVDNPPVRYAERRLEYEEGERPDAWLEIHEERVQSALSRNDSPDLGFRWSLNPYRGCYHGCIYCYARPSHAYWGWGAGTDFERKIVVKVNIAEELERELQSRRWKRETVAISGNTDPYQPLEGRYRLTRRCLEVFLRARTPVSVVTKGALVAQDADLLAELARHVGARVTISIAFDDDETARRLEPWASPPSRRFDALRVLSEAGVPTSVAVAPIVPGINEASIPSILERARDAGARAAWMTLLRLPGEVGDVFEARLSELWPERVSRVRRALYEMRGGRVTESRFGHRMRGVGERWAMVERLFELTCRRLGLRTGPVGDADPASVGAVSHQGRSGDGQLALFDDEV
ncbi:MAG: PA0069 family radical SAM protein [Myxococcota bacterium]|nr:PA0069 family radical SAM protein [Myxococcota bacterium]MDW8362917.1 PA0069 family radical SAM protein [Myxococcales bacterium]